METHRLESVGISTVADLNDCQDLNAPKKYLNTR